MSFINISELVIYPFWNDKVHLYIDSIVWYNSEYKEKNEYNMKLEKDIMDNGIKHSLLVEKLFDGKYGIIDGNHRFYIALKLGIKLLPCEIITTAKKIESIMKQRTKLINPFVNFKYTKPNTELLEIKKYYNMEDKRILELGPFEGWNTCVLEYMNPREIVSIEGKLENYRKCNFFKFFYKLDKTLLVYGDIEKMNIEELGQFDFCVARGILHYLTNPVKTIKKLCIVTENLWLGVRLATKDFDNEEICCEGYKGKKMSNNKNNPLSGLYNYSIWLYKDELLKLLKDIGYINITIVKEPKIYNEKTNYAEIYARK